MASGGVVGKHVFLGAVSDTSTDVNDLGGTGGEIRQEGNNTFRLCYALETLAGGMPVQLDTSSGTDGFSVERPTNTTIPAFAVYNQLGTTTLTTGVYFWGQQKGIGMVLNGAATVNSYIPVVASTAGIVSNTSANGSMGHSFASIAAAATATIKIDCE